MAQNLNNATVNAANNNINKEEMIMMNKSVQELKAMAKELGIKGYSNLKKAELVNVLSQYGTENKYPVNPLDDPEVMALDVSDDALLPPIAEVAPIPVVPVVGTIVTNTNTNVKEENVMTTEKKKMSKEDCDAMMLVIAWIYQSIHDVMGDKRVLFYEATKRTDLGKVKISSNKKLMKVTGDVIEKKYGKSENNYETIQKCYDLMVERGLCHRNGDNIHMTVAEWNKCREIYMRDDIKPFIAEYRKFVSSVVIVKKTTSAKVVKTEVVATVLVLDNSKLDQNIKNQLNAAWRNKQIKVESSTSNNNMYRVTSLNAEGKKLLDSVVVQNNEVAPF